MHLKYISAFLLQDNFFFNSNEDMSDLEGQQTGVVTKALVKVVPCSISNSWQEKNINACVSLAFSMSLCMYIDRNAPILLANCLDRGDPSL